MQIRIIRQCMVQSVPRFIGDVIEVPTDTANLLLHMHRAVVHKPEESPTTIETRDPIVEHRDPEIEQPKRGPGRPKKNA